MEGEKCPQVNEGDSKLSLNKTEVGSKFVPIFLKRGKKFVLELQKEVKSVLFCELKANFYL